MARTAAHQSRSVLRLRAFVELNNPSVRSVQPGQKPTHKVVFFISGLIVRSDREWLVASQALRVSVRLLL